jgi:hypothetical protein
MTVYGKKKNVQLQPAPVPWVKEGHTLFFILCTLHLDFPQITQDHPVILLLMHEVYYLQSSFPLHGKHSKPLLALPLQKFCHADYLPL